MIFEKAVVFKSLVTFEDRVIFGDRDMGGNVILPVGTTRVHVTFTRPYTEIPVVTITAVDHAISAGVSGLSPSGFDIEISNPTSTNISFNWMAVLVR